MIGLFYIDNIYKCIWFLFVFTCIFRCLEKKYFEYTNWVVIASIIFSSYRVVYYIDKMDYVFEEFWEDISTLVFLLNVLVAIIPSCILSLMYIKKKNSIKRMNEIDKMDIKDF